MYVQSLFQQNCSNQNFYLASARLDLGKTGTQFFSVRLLLNTEKH